MYDENKEYGHDDSVHVVEYIEPKTSINVVGLNEIGAATIATLSNHGYHVIGLDADYDKLAAIANGASPAANSALDPLIRAGVDAGRIRVTADLATAVTRSALTILAIDEDDLGLVRTAAKRIGRGLTEQRGDDFHVVLLHCAVPPRAAMGVMIREIEAASGLRVGIDFGVAFKPEFVRHGTTITDYRAPPMSVVGASDERTARVLARIIAPIDNAPILIANGSDEMVRNVDDAWHAARTSGPICAAFRWCPAAVYRACH